MIKWEIENFDIYKESNNLQNDSVSYQFDFIECLIWLGEKKYINILFLEKMHIVLGNPVSSIKT